MSENDLEITGEESHTVEEAGNTDSTCAASGGTETPAKKAEVMLTPEHESFHKFRPVASKIDKPRISQLGHISGRGASTKSFLMQQQDMKSVYNRLVRRKDLKIDAR